MKIMKNEEKMEGLYKNFVLIIINDDSLLFPAGIRAFWRGTSHAQGFDGWRQLHSVQWGSGPELLF